MATDLYPTGADHAERTVYDAAGEKMRGYVVGRVFLTTADVDNAVAELAHIALDAYRSGWEAGHEAAEAYPCEHVG